LTVLPNSFERYVAALRILTSLLILKHGYNKKYLKNLCKIYIAESYYKNNPCVPLDIRDYSLSLFCAVAFLKYKQNKKFEFSVDTDGNFLINKSIFTVLLLKLCKECEIIDIKAGSSGIIINLKGNHKKSLSALKKLKGFYFYSSKTNNGKFVIPAKKTDQKSVSFPSVWENIHNRFSPVNLFFENIL